MSILFETFLWPEKSRLHEGYMLVLINPELRIVFFVTAVPLIIVNILVIIVKLVFG